MIRPFLVGELNPRSSDPHHALYPLPPGCSGARLCGYLGMTPLQYIRTFDRRNLCVGEWDSGRAHLEALRIILLEPPTRPIVLLGHRVAMAFSLRPMSYFERVGRYIYLPHPSGRNLVWNDPANVARAREAVLSVLA